MARKKKEEVLDAPVAEEPEEKGASVAVYFNGQYVRAYSKELHGNDYKGLAKEFAEKVPGREVRSK